MNLRNRSLSLFVVAGLGATVASASSAFAKESISTATGGSPGALTPERQSTFYVVAAHPDDDQVGWSYLEQLPRDTYVVFVTMTRGEGTESCLKPEDSYNRPGSDALPIGELETFARRLHGQTIPPPLPRGTDEDSTGPYKYEGPGSPVGEPDKGERHPLGDPWVGQGTEACKDAVAASHHWFQDEQFHNDGIGTDLDIENDPKQDDDFKGIFCPAGHQGRGSGQPIEKQIGCAEVWADELGARILFDLGNAPYDNGFPAPAFTSQQVTAALQSVRTHRGEWGITVLPEQGVLATTMYRDGETCPSSAWLGPDHAVVNEAIRYQDQGLPLRAGLMGCAGDKLGEGATVRELVQAPTSLVMWNLLDPVGGKRLGAAVKNYGWMFPDYAFFGCDVCNYWEIRT